MTNEIWKEVIGYEGLYEVSTHGNVRSIDRKGTDGRELKGKNLNFRIHSAGYNRVSLYKDDIKKDRYVHRLLAEAFVENNNPDKYNFVNHINGIKNDNRIENLEWIDSFGNMKHAWDNGLMENAIKNLALKNGRNCSLIHIDTNEIIKFETMENLSVFLGYGKAWLSKAVSINGNYKKACLKKGYIIELEQLL